MSVHYELRCRECGKTWGNVPRSFCEDCFSPLEVAYDYDSLKKIARRENLASRDFNMWRYSELLPLPENFTGPNAVGGTPLVASHKLAAKWGLKNLYFKNDAVLRRVCARPRAVCHRRHWVRRNCRAAATIPSSATY